MTDLCETCQNFNSCGKREQFEGIRKIVKTCPLHNDITNLPKISLQDVYKVFLKWFPNLDTTRIDTRLAWYLSNEFGLGNPLWLFELSRSGSLKSTLTNAFIGTPKIFDVNQLTPKYLASCAEVGFGKNKKPAPDFGMKLTNRNRCVIVGESASIKAMNQGDQRELFAILKSLHDGIIQRNSGSGISKYYPNCNTSIWFNSTPDFRNEAIIHQEIGTCYLVDVIPLDMEKDIEDSANAIDNSRNQKQIIKETNDAIKCYLAHHRLKKYSLSEEEKKGIISESNRLKYLRTTGNYDKFNELTYIPEPETPSRVSIQLSKLYESLMSLDNNYKKERAKNIIQRIVDGSGDHVLVYVLEFLDSLWTIKQAKQKDTYFTIPQIIMKRGLGTGKIKRRLELLCGLDILIKMEKSSGGKGGRPGWKYKLHNNIKPEVWQSLFRHPIYNH